MPFSSSTELLNWLGEHLFLNTQQVDELRPWVASQSDLHALCKELLRRDWLTPFQVNQLLKNNGDTLVVGANRLHSRLGEGAMGQVYRAWNIRLGRMVAVKMLHADHALSAKAMDRFRREMQTAAALVHPNIVLLRDADECNKIPYLVMDYFECTDLSRKMRAEGAQPIRQAVEYIRQAALGLQHAFQQGIVHRDIKPSNILLTKSSDGGPVIKILDFGLAKFSREEDGQQPLTQAGRLIGTIDYIAPEQALDAHNADIRADIYSLGCTLYYFLTAKAPFPGNDHLEKLSARIQGTPPRLRDARPEAPTGLEEVLLKMMAREPADRYQTPAEVVAALTPYARETAVALPTASLATTAVSATPVAAVAVPMATTPALAVPVIQALPVKAQVATAAPVAPAEFEVVPVREEASTGDFFSGPDFAQPRDNEEIRTRKRTPETDLDDTEASPRSRRPLILAGVGVALLLVLVLVAIVYFIPRGPKIEPVIGTMTVELDHPPDRVWAWNERKPIIVKIKRQKFDGPVTISVDPCPNWLRYEPVKIAAGKETGQIEPRIAVGDILGPQTIKITVSSPLSQPASIDYEMDIIKIRAFKGAANNGK